MYNFGDGQPKQSLMCANHNEHSRRFQTIPSTSCCLWLASSSHTWWNVDGSPSLCVPSTHWRGGRGGVLVWGLIRGVNSWWIPAHNNEITASLGRSHRGGFLPTLIAVGLPPRSTSNTPPPSLPPSHQSLFNLYLRNLTCSKLNDDNHNYHDQLTIHLCWDIIPANNCWFSWWQQWLLCQSFV